MSEIKIFVRSLGAYNEGRLNGAWFTLPISMDEIFNKIFKPHELDENGNPHGDWAIHDYEAPFEIQEHTDIKYLNEIAELFESMSTEDIQIACSLHREGVIWDLTEAKDAVDHVIRFHGCKNMSDIAYFIIQDRYGNSEEHKLFLRHFDYESYGDELETSGTYVFVNNELAVQYLN